MAFGLSFLYLREGKRRTKTEKHFYKWPFEMSHNRRWCDTPRANISQKEGKKKLFARFFSIRFLYNRFFFISFLVLFNFTLVTRPLAHRRQKHFLRDRKCLDTTSRNYGSEMTINMGVKHVKIFFI